MTRTMLKAGFMLLLPVLTLYGQYPSDGRERFDASALSLTTEQYSFLNPARLIFDETISLVRLGPSISLTDGSYRRLYEPDAVRSYEMTSSVVNVLGNKGTFHGSAG